MRALGVDGCPGGWVGALVEDGQMDWCARLFAAAGAATRPRGRRRLPRRGDRGVEGQRWLAGTAQVLGDEVDALGVPMRIVV